MSAKAARPSAFLIKPVVLAKMLQAAEIKETDRVLVVGCATGYAAAVIAQFAGRGDRDRERSGAGREGAGLLWPAMAVET